MLASSRNYKKIGQWESQRGEIAAWKSTDIENSCWDEFLRLTPLGQFQQSSIWARAKVSEGWKPVRVIFTMDEAIVGGFQLLERSSWWGKIGYVSKGPVVLPGALPAQYVAEMLQVVARKEWLWALVVQPPDLCEQMPASLVAQGFILNVLTGVNEATWVNDVGGDFAMVEGRMNKTSRYQLRQARLRNVRIRDGTREEVGAFFDLMVSTCRRQGVKPNPPDRKTLLALWDAASPSGAIRLTFAEHQGQIVAGLLCICFGQTVSVWKKGWTSLDRKLFANDLLTYETLEWANYRGYQIADFAAFDVEVAIRLGKGEPPSPKPGISRHMFNMRFGGRAVLLPEARVFLPNPAIRSACHVVFHGKLARARERYQIVNEVRRTASETRRPVD